MTRHHISSGVYAREMELKRGYEAKSHKHTFDHLSILAKGVAVVTVDNKSITYEAPAVVTIKKGKVHSILAITDAVWFCIHGEENYRIEEINIKESECHGQ